jgi:WD40 repeat protein
MGHDADDLEAVQRAGREHIYRTSLYVLRNFAFTSRFNRVRLLLLYSSPVAAPSRHRISVCVWDLDTGKMVHTLEGHELSLFGVAVTPDGRLAVSASADWLCWTIMPSHGEHRAVFRKLTSGLPWRHQCFRRA